MAQVFPFLIHSHKEEVGQSAQTNAVWHLGRDMGGCKTYGGRKTYQRTRSPENFLNPSKRAPRLLCRGFLCRKNRALTPEGGGKRTVRGGVQNPFLGWVSFVRFSTPLLFPPPHGVLRGIARAERTQIAKPQSQTDSQRFSLRGS